MIFLFLTAVPPGLRGDLTKWLNELGAGVFAGRVTRRVRENLWRRVKRGLGSKGGTARMVIIDHTREQGYQVLAAGDDRWVPKDYDGLTLMVRPQVQTTGGKPAQAATGG